MKEIEIISRKNKIIKTVLLDDEDFLFINRWKWHLSESNGLYYAMRNERRADGSIYHVSMHRVIMGVFDKEIEIDHKDHNGLNNQKYNLRTCTGDENKRNRSKTKNTSSKYMGVHLRVRVYKNGFIYKTWISNLHTRKNKSTRKSFPYTEQGEIDAAKYYDQLASKQYGEFANLNFK